MLTISRSDVSSEEITDYPAETRFIKLPITKYLELLRGNKPDETNRPQYALINAINNPKYRFVCAALARRLGKTWISNVIGQLVILVPGSNVLIISPNYNLSSISFELPFPLIELCETYSRTFPILIYSELNRELIITKINFPQRNPVTM